MKSYVRSVIVVVAFCSWFAVSNHCAFAALATTADPVQAECPFHSKPAKQEKQSTGAQCCKILRAVTPVVTKNWARDDSKIFRANHCFNEFILPTADSHTTPVPLLLDTGPPLSHSFAELILQQSLLAHAPPILA
ncbi:MAG TPA: hypothetical protein VFQ83_00755 [Candidatus Udaeobacter sp.]|jgi:hypothetical protein|nr:hypothetical protein [Candidatus Udaeobacter sp.]